MVSLPFVHSARGGDKQRLDHHRQHHSSTRLFPNKTPSTWTLPFNMLKMGWGTRFQIQQSDA
jgi:hypothetical protein